MNFLRYGDFCDRDQLISEHPCQPVITWKVFSRQDKPAVSRDVAITPAVSRDVAITPTRTEKKGSSYHYYFTDLCIANSIFCFTPICIKANTTHKFKLIASSWTIPFSSSTRERYAQWISKSIKFKSSTMSLNAWSGMIWDKLPLIDAMHPIRLERRMMPEVERVKLSFPPSYSRPHIGRQRLDFNNWGKPTIGQWVIPILAWSSEEPNSSGSCDVKHV